MFLYKNPYNYPWDFSKPIEENFCDSGNFEAILDKDGNMYQIPNGHTQGAIGMLLHDNQLDYDTFLEIADISYYMEWLLYFSKTVLLRSDSFQGYLNEKQSQTIDKLIEKGLMKGRYDLMHNPYFNPEEYFKDVVLKQFK